MEENDTCLSRIRVKWKGYDSINLGEWRSYSEFSSYNPGVFKS